MLRLFISIIYIFFLLSSQNLHAQFWTEKAKNLKADFNQTEFDFGKIKPENEIRIRVGFKNTGDAFLQVQNIAVTPEQSANKLNFIWPKGAVLPEDSAAIEMIFKAANVPDSFRFNATILFNNNYSSNLIIKGKVDKRQYNDKKGPILHVENNFCDLDKISTGSRNNCKFKIMNIGDEPLIIKSVKPDNDDIAVTWPKTGILPGQQAEINADFNAEGNGSFRRYLNVETNVKGSEPVLLIIKGKLPSRR